MLFVAGCPLLWHNCWTLTNVWILSLCLIHILLIIGETTDFSCFHLHKMLNHYLISFVIGAATQNYSNVLLLSLALCKPLPNSIVASETSLGLGHFKGFKQRIIYSKVWEMHIMLLSPCVLVLLLPGPCFTVPTLVPRSKSFPSTEPQADMTLANVSG